MPRHKKNIFACFIGNLLEWYDFAIYGYLAATLGALFFPTEDPLTATLSSYGVFAAGFFMRPIGAFALGYMGDKWGRKSALMVSILLMALATAGMGLLPTYAQIGLWSTILMIVCRLFQGFSLGGEFSGSIILLIEHAPSHRKAFFGSWADLGSSMGMILASLTIIALRFSVTEQELLDWAWRLPFLSGFLLAIVGYFLRRNLDETPEFISHKATTQKVPLSPAPLKEILLNHLKPFILAATFLMINAIGYYFLIVFIPTQTLGKISVEQLSLLTLSSLVIMMPATFISAFLSDRYGQIRCIFLGYMGTLVLAYPLVWATVNGSFAQQFFVQGLFAICLGFCYGPRSALIASIFPTAIRYTAVSLSYSLANAFFGGTAPLVSALLMEKTGHPASLAGYLILSSIISLVSVLWLARLKSVPRQELAPRVEVA